MRRIQFMLPVLLILIFVLGGCGYYFPHVYDGPTQNIYMPNWKNRTSELGLDSDIYRLLSRWFQKSNSIILTKDRASADLILAGEIKNIDLPSISWDGNASATEVRVKLTVRYILKDLRNDKILWEVGHELWTEEYSTLGGSATMSDNEKKALDQILDDMSERIYLGTLDKIRKLDTAGQ